jgi:hypothetical protein
MITSVLTSAPYLKTLPLSFIFFNLTPYIPLSF